MVSSGQTFSAPETARYIPTAEALTARRTKAFSPAIGGKSSKIVAQPAPKTVVTSNAVVHLWTEEEIENVRKLLPKIANGRKTRYSKVKKKQSKKK